MKQRDNDLFPLLSDFSFQWKKEWRFFFSFLERESTSSKEERRIIVSPYEECMFSWWIFLSDSHSVHQQVWLFLLRFLFLPHVTSISLPVPFSYTFSSSFFSRSKLPRIHFAELRNYDILKGRNNANIFKNAYTHVCLSHWMTTAFNASPNWKWMLLTEKRGERRRTDIIFKVVDTWRTKDKSNALSACSSKEVFLFKARDRDR